MQVVTSDRENGTRRVSLVLNGESKVEQSHRDECNINSIISKYHRTGLITHLNSKPTYGDFTNSVDFHQTQNRLINAENEFMELPSDIRTRFHNDPGSFLDFMSDPDNESEAISLGLMNPPPTGGNRSSCGA